jgi:hypothetical protein
MAKAIKFGSLGDLFSKAFHFTKGASFAQLYTEVEPDLPKSSEFYGRVKKKQNHNVQLNFNYSNAVNNQLMMEGSEPTFAAQAPKWGTRIPGTPLISHVKKGSDITSFYLMTRVLRSSPADYFLDGVFVDSIPMLAAIMGDMPARYSNAKHQGIEKEVIIRTFKLDSIRAITMDGETLVVEKE